MTTSFSSAASCSCSRFSAPTVECGRGTRESTERNGCASLCCSVDIRKSTTFRCPLQRRSCSCRRRQLKAFDSLWATTGAGGLLGNCSTDSPDATRPPLAVAESIQTLDRDGGVETEEALSGPVPVLAAESGSIAVGAHGTGDTRDEEEESDELMGDCVSKTTAGRGGGTTVLLVENTWGSVLLDAAALTEDHDEKAEDELPPTPPLDAGMRETELRDGAGGRRRRDTESPTPANEDKDDAEEVKLLPPARIPAGSVGSVTGGPPRAREGSWLFLPPRPLDPDGASSSSEEKEEDAATPSCPPFPCPTHSWNSRSSTIGMGDSPSRMHFVSKTHPVPSARRTYTTPSRERDLEASNSVPSPRTTPVRGAATDGASRTCTPPG
mmetsp:Transcript_329/g.1071  ORF Transcript_329/g.1071 Transcript_329/m.1071 type:complete len:382 (+) Transcript_329:709-1854(+)